MMIINYRWLIILFPFILADILLDITLRLLRQRRFWIGVFAVLIVVVASASVKGESFEELTAQRRNFGLPPLTRDAELMEFAQQKAEWQASHHITLQNGHNGHEGPRVPGCDEGTGQLAPHWGWGSCMMRCAGSPRAGTGLALGTDGRRYMVLIIRGNNREINGHRNLIDTAHLTPNLPITPFVGYATRESRGLHTPIHYSFPPQEKRAERVHVPDSATMLVSLLLPSPTCPTCGIPHD